MKNQNKVIFLALCASVMLNGCGGGGGGGGGAPAVAAPVASTLAFPFQSALKAAIAAGYTKTFTVSRTSVTGSVCTGSGNKSASAAATPATFEGQAGLSALVTTTWTSANCIPASSAQSVTVYFDINYNSLGMNNPGVNYGVYLTPPVIPLSVNVGSTGTIGTETLYTDSTKTVLNGTAVESYVVEADTATTAIVNRIAKINNAAGTLVATEQDRFRISSVGALVPISVDIQYAAGDHVVMTYN